MSDPGAYTSQVATAEEPIALPDRDGALFDGDLDSVLNGQRDVHASVSVVPCRYVQAGDSPAFKALVRHTQAIERDDVIVTVPVAIAWLKEKQYLPQMIAGLNRIPHPKAVMFGDQKNPFDSAAAVVNFRTLLAETTNKSARASSGLVGGGYQRVSQRCTPVEHLAAGAAAEHHAGAEHHLEVIADGPDG
jgi:hypothetical protein